MLRSLFVAAEFSGFKVYSLKSWRNRGSSKHTSHLFADCGDDSVFAVHVFALDDAAAATAVCRWASSSLSSRVELFFSISLSLSSAHFMLHYNVSFTYLDSAGHMTDGQFRSRLKTELFARSSIPAILLNLSLCHCDSTFLFRVFGFTPR